MKAHEKMTKARTAMILDTVFFGDCALHLKMEEITPVEDSGCDTMWTDGVTLGYNPDFVDSLPMDILKTAIAHEVLHVVYLHQCRRDNRDPEEWNIACDYAVNSALKDSKHVNGSTMFNVPSNWLYDAKFKGMHAETIHAALFGKKQKQQNSGNGSGQGQPQQNNQQQPGQGQGKGGTGKTTQPGEVRDFKGTDGQPASGTEKDTHEQQWKIVAQQAISAAEKGCGSVPGDIKKIIKDLVAPKVSWREVLHRFVEQQAKNDYSWARPNRRYTDFILPSLRSEKLPPVMVIVDTSGSVGKEDLAQFASECEDILTQYDTELQVVYCDTKVRGTEKFTREDMPIVLNAAGGGGTKFSPALRFVSEMDEPITCAIYLTDMDCSDFGTMPEYPLLWVQTEGPEHLPPFGEYVRMNPIY